MTIQIKKEPTLAHFAKNGVSSRTVTTELQR
jgi:hypothetical protein